MMGENRDTRRADRAVADYRETLNRDGEAMRASQGFRNQFFSNAGRQNALLGIREDELELLEAIATRVDELRR